MSDTPQLLLAHHLKALKLPTFLREYDKQARQCAAEGVDHVRYLVRLTELELIDRERRMVERRIRMAKFPAVKSLDSFDFKAMPSLNKMLVLELARCEYVERRENIIALGNSGTGKTHIALGLGLAACQKGLSVGFLTAAALVHELMEARDEKRLLRLQKQLAKYHLLIIDELGFVPLSKTGAELLFEVFSQRYERGSILVTSNLPFDEWTEIFGSERLTGALLDRLTHHVHILEMNGESYRLNQSQNGGNPQKYRLTAGAMVDPVGPQEPPTLLRSAYRKRYSKQRGSLLWTTGTTPQHRVPHNVKWTSFAPPGWTNFAPPLTSMCAHLGKKIPEQDDEHLLMLLVLEHQVRGFVQVNAHEHCPIHHAVDHRPCGVEDDCLAFDFVHRVSVPPYGSGLAVAGAVNSQEAPRGQLKRNGVQRRPRN